MLEYFLKKNCAHAQSHSLFYFHLHYPSPRLMCFISQCERNNCHISYY